MTEGQSCGTILSQVGGRLDYYGDVMQLTTKKYNTYEEAVRCLKDEGYHLYQDFSFRREVWQEFRKGRSSLCLISSTNDNVSNYEYVKYIIRRAR